MSERENIDMVLWWEQQWDRYHNSIYAVLMIIILSLLYYYVGSTFISLVLGIFIETIGALILVVLSYTLFRQVGLMKAERERKEFLNKLERSILKLIIREYEFKSMLDTSGLVGIYESLPNDTLIETFSESRENIYILHTWVSSPQRFEKAFAEAAQNGCKIRILLLDPNSPSAIQRSFDSWPLADPAEVDKNYAPSNIKLNISVFQRIKAKNGIEDMEIRLYDTLPSVQLYIGDNNSFVGFFPKGRLARESSQMRIQGDTFLTRQFFSEFEHRWEKAKRV